MKITPIVLGLALTAAGCSSPKNTDEANDAEVTSHLAPTSASLGPCPQDWLASISTLTEDCLNHLIPAQEVLFPDFKARGEDPMDFYQENTLPGQISEEPEHPHSEKVEKEMAAIDTEGFNLSNQIPPDIVTQVQNALAGVGGDCSNLSLNKSGSIGFQVPFPGRIGPVTITDFGAVRWRHHWVYGQADYTGAANIYLSGSIYGAGRTWSVTAGGSATGSAAANVLAWQNFQRFRSSTRHTVATAAVHAELASAIT